MKRCLVLILLFIAVLPLRGQDYDAALDRFAAITNECQRLKARIEEGEDLQESTLDSVIAELRLLQKELQGGSKTMSSAQKDRYRLILKCYQEGKMVPVSALHADSVQSGITDGQPSALSHPEPRLGREIAGTDTHCFFMATASWPLEGGLAMGFMRPGRKWGGAFLHASGDAWYPKFSLTATSDGTSGTGFIWTNGNTRYSRFTGTVDAIWFLFPGPVGLYTGGGYGFTRTFWQTTDNTWALISDKSVSGPTAELGIIYSHRHFILSAGATTIAFRTISCMVGFGYCF